MVRLVKKNRQPFVVDEIWKAILLRHILSLARSRETYQVKVNMFFYVFDFKKNRLSRPTFLQRHELSRHWVQQQLWVFDHPEENSYNYVLNSTYVVKSQFVLVMCLLFVSAYDVTDPQLRPWPSFTVDSRTNADEVHKMFCSEHYINYFENDAMFA